MRHRFAALLSLLCAGGLSACTAMQARPEPVVLAVTLDDLLPHGDRDHFVFVYERFANGKPAGSGIQVEHVSVLGNGELEITESEDGILLGRSRWREDDTTLSLVSEDAAALGLRFSYDPPLAFFAKPLLSGEREQTSTATAVRLSDGEPVGVFKSRLVVKVAEVSSVPTPLGNYEHGVVLKFQRTLEASQGALDFTAESVYVPGVGEVRSDAWFAAASTQHRELACAIISGRRVGDCSDLHKRIP